MTKELAIKINELSNILDDISYDLEDAIRTLGEVEDNIREEESNTIKDVNNFKRELKRDGLYSDKIEEFIEQYMNYYNK